MKLFHTHASPLRIWLGMLLVGYLGGTLLAALILVPHALLKGRWWLDPRWVAGAITAFAFYLAFKCAPLEIRARRQEREAAVTLPGHHPQFGPFEFRPFYHSWAAVRPLLAETQVRLSGPGPEPSAAHIAFWERFAADPARLTAAAQDRLLPLPKPHPLAAQVRLTPTDLQFNDDGTVDLSLATIPATVTCDLLLWPSATFSADLELIDAEWSP